MSVDRPVAAALVGLGRWGRNLATAAQSRPQGGLRIAAAATRSPAKAKAFCDEQGIALCDDLGVLLADPGIEAVVLATPHSQHCAQIKAAAAVGKHVFVEKPLALTLAEAEEAVAACAAAGVVLAVGFNRRFLPAYRALCESYAAGTLGEALHVEGNFSGSFGYGYTADMWRGSSAENPAGGMAAMGIHVLDAMIHLLGPLRRVTTRSRRRVLEALVDDTTISLLEFEGGATGSLSTIMATPSHWRLQLFGSKGWAAMPDQARLVVSTLEGEPSETRFDPADTLTDELEAFARTIRRGEAYPVTTDEALAGVGAFEAIARSAAEGGRTIEVASV